MTMRSIKMQHPAIREDIADLKTHRAMPTVHVRHIDPFLFLNHHGPQTYPPKNAGLPFTAHPHRGFEIVTFILKGDIAHRDTGGHESIVKAGGVQWMTAGRGLVHSELSSDEFKDQGGELEILQLWVNLPAKLKMTKPRYIGLQHHEIPSFHTDNGRVTINLISGTWNGHTGPVASLTDVHLLTAQLSPGGRFDLSVAADHSIFFYLVKGQITVNNQLATSHHLIEFQNDGDRISMEASSEVTLIFGHALPYHEPIVAQGPFVMNAREEIIEAIKDYQEGKMG